MNELKNIVALTALVAPFSALAFDDPVESKIAFYCDQQTGAFFISAVSADRPKVAKKLRKHVMNWAALLKIGPEKNGWGDPLRTGTTIKSERCGPIKVTFSSGFPNANPQGELGALDFPVIEISKGKQVLLKPTAIEQCDVNIPRFNYFGQCPNSWARSIEVIPTPEGLTIEVKRFYTDEDYNEVERTDVLR